MAGAFGACDDLEGKVKWLDNYQKVKQLKEVLVWLPVWEADKKAHVPEVNITI
ncbi:pleckstrin-likey domain-containing family G member 7 isoform X2 [Silurus asotus]|uniref:Pleckstrin-likey domain-containing family G member 7 isoform X2 n=1 Tax=Silurus asotus TaxID=30991 RepID=A0AAD5B5H2_SILAS|nr:pleckstrin-likey domain-containing family G member 7 isoform X2 [Silurus asotus]